MRTNCGLCQPGVTFNSAHMISLFLIPKRALNKWQKERRQWKYLANEINSLELNCIWWGWNGIKNPFSIKILMLILILLKEFLASCWLVVVQGLVLLNNVSKAVFDDVTLFIGKTLSYCWSPPSQEEFPVKSRILSETFCSCNELENEQSRHDMHSNYTAQCCRIFRRLFFIPRGEKIRLRLSTRVHFLPPKNNSINSCATLQPWGEIGKEVKRAE